MLHIQTIDSLEGPGLEPYRTLRRTLDHQEKGIFVAEGEKLVQRLLESNFTVVSVLLPEKCFPPLEPLLRRRPEEIQVYLLEKKLLEQITGLSFYQGVMAVGKIPPRPSLDQVLHSSARPYLLVAVEGITNAENMGALVRNCAAFGTQGLLVGETCSSPYLRRAVRNSMGAIFRLAIVEPPHLAQTLQNLRATGIRCIAAHPRTPSITVAQSDLKGDCCLVFGSEGYGLSPTVLEACDQAAAIPMQNGVDSLNVGNAAAVFLYEANRQRGAI